MIPNHGQIRLGDSFSEGEKIEFTGLPTFAPEFLKSVLSLDPMKSKHLEKALTQFAEEGMSKIFKPLLGSGWVIGVVGASKGNFGFMIFGLVLSVILTGALATYLANYVQKHLWIVYVGLAFILLVALQLIIGGLNDYGVLSINETFKQYF